MLPLLVSLIKAPDHKIVCHFRGTRPGPHTSLAKHHKDKWCDVGTQRYGNHQMTHRYSTADFSRFNTCSLAVIPGATKPHVQVHNTSLLTLLQAGLIVSHHKMLANQMNGELYQICRQ